MHRQIWTDKNLKNCWRSLAQSTCPVLCLDNSYQLLVYKETTSDSPMPRIFKRGLQNKKNTVRDRAYTTTVITKCLEELLSFLWTVFYFKT